MVEGDGYLLTLLDSGFLLDFGIAGISVSCRYRSDHFDDVSILDYFSGNVSFPKSKWLPRTSMKESQSGIFGGLGESLEELGNKVGYLEVVLGAPVVMGLRVWGLSFIKVDRTGWNGV